MRGRSIILLIAAVISASLSLSCSREDGALDADALHKELFGAYHSAKFFTGISVSSNLAVISFSDDSELSIKLDALPLLDCRMAEVPQPKVLSPGVSDGNSSLEFLAYDYHNLYIGLSNGALLHIPDSPKGSLLSFAFLRKDNPSLPNDVNCSISGDHIYIKLPSGYFGTHLKPTIRCRGKSFKIVGDSLSDGSFDFGQSRILSVSLVGGGVTSYHIVTEVSFPAVKIHTDAPVLSKTAYVGGAMRIENPDARYPGPAVFESAIQIRGRGNSTWGMPKRPYKIKLDAKASIFGVPKDKDWVLLANYSDKSLLRNELGLHLSSILGLSWTPAAFPVELYINDEYLGLYDFTEHKEVSSDRVKLPSGGYYLEIEAKRDNPVWFNTSMGMPIMFNTPETPDAEALAYVKSFFKAFEDALRRCDGTWKEYIDTDSFAANYIVQELSKNIDADLFKSLFLVLDPTAGKLSFCHVWDFDLAFGNCDYFQGHRGMDNSFKGWYIRDYTNEGYGTGWYWYLFKDSDFVQAVKKAWISHYDEFAASVEWARDLSSRISPAAHRNFERWDILSRYVWPNVVYLGDYNAEVDYMLKFYSDRLSWMDEQIRFW